MNSETGEPVALGPRDGYDRWAAHDAGLATPPPSLWPMLHVLGVVRG